jgi:hypothetical protein
MGLNPLPRVGSRWHHPDCTTSLKNIKKSDLIIKVFLQYALW